MSVEAAAPAIRRDTEVRDLARSLAMAADERIRRVVAMVDAMPERGDADAVIAPLRPRLARLRPTRQVNFARLLFRPLDAVIVPTASWQSAGPGIPRSALAPLAREVRRNWTGIEAIDVGLAEAGANDDGAAGLLTIGGRIWPAAVPRLLSAIAPEDWTALTGLSRADHAPIVQSTAMVLAQGATILRLTEGGAEDPAAADGALGRLWSGAMSLATEFAAVAQAAARTAGDPAPAAATTTTALATLGALLMLRLSRGDRALMAMEAAFGDDATHADCSAQAIAFVLARLSDAPLLEDLRGAGEATGHAATLLGLLDTLMANRPAPLRSLVEARRTLDTRCHTRFDMTAALLAASASSTDRQEAEHLARHLRTFAIAARRIGGESFYDQALLVALAHLVEPKPDRDTATHHARLADILAGPGSDAGADGERWNQTAAAQYPHTTIGE
jgi:hypothetical protein